MARSPRLGFKLIELVLVIGIVGLAICLIVPAVLKVREAQARSQTNDNLHACAIAVHNYHGINKRLPNAAWTGGIYKEAGEDRSLWFHLLPFVGQQAVYDGNIHDAAVPTYLASSDPSLRDPAGRVCFAGNIRLFGYQTLGATNANNAVTTDKCELSGLTLKEHLAAAMSSGLTLARVPDGTSNVFMLATRYAECGSWAQSTYYSASPIGSILAAGGTAPSSGAPKGPGKGSFFGAGSHDRYPDATSLGATFQLAPRLDECLADDSVFGHSFGRGSLSVAMADASLKNIDPNLSPTNFCRALCPGDGCPIENRWGGWGDD